MVINLDSNKTSKSSVISPSTESEWTTHVLNIHGVFFEKWCEKQIEKQRSWKVRSTQYPVEYPPPNGPWRGKESVLDIRAEHKKNDVIVTLPIECKKNNPEFTNWIFFEKHPKTLPRNVNSSRIRNVEKQSPAIGWEPQLEIYPFLTSYPIANAARETKGNYVERAKKSKGSITKTANAAIGDAAFQVALATQTLFTEEHAFCVSLSAASKKMPYKVQVFMPIVVTTAKLYLCNFDPQDVSGSSGEIPYDKVELSEQPHIVYEYPLPRSLQKGPANLIDAISSNSLEMFVRMDILVINSEHFSQFLTNMAKGLSEKKAKAK